MVLMINQQSRYYWNAVGKSNGYGGCSICGNTWNWKKPHYIGKARRACTSGMFPYCEECNGAVSNAVKLRAIAKLVAKWIWEDMEYPTQLYRDVPLCLWDGMQAVYDMLSGR